MSKRNSVKKPQAQPVVIENQNPIPNPSPIGQQAFWLLKTGIATKIGKQTNGGITYRILGNVERDSLYITITANDGGGYFSREMVPFNKVKDCLSERVHDTFPSKLFKESFVGRSSNNAGFLAAILRAEGLLALALETETQNIVAADWAKWQQSMLEEKGEMIDIEVLVPDKNQLKGDPEEDGMEEMKATKTLTVKHLKDDASEE